jgi:hypothetical protein
MSERFFIGDPPRQAEFRGIQEALEYCHENKLDLYEDDEDDLNILYRQDWEISMRRAVWRSLRASRGLSSMKREALPKELTRGTYGPDFEVD